MKTPEEALSNYTISGDCWLWNKAIADTGYGILNFNGKTIAAHRLSYKLHKGEIPKGLFVMHSCDVRACINPDHLRLGTNADNVADMVSKGRIARGMTRRDCKLSDNDVLEIRRLCGDGIPHKDIALMFGVARPTITQIGNFKKRIHVEVR